MRDGCTPKSDWLVPVKLIILSPRYEVISEEIVKGSTWYLFIVGDSL